MSGIEEALHVISQTFGTEEDVISLEFIDIGQTISTWTSYSFRTDFMEANSSWSFECADDRYFDLFKKLQNGQKVALKVNNKLAATGYVDQINIMSSRTGGTIMQVRGRDTLGPVCDACVDPKFLFDGQKTAKDVVKKLVAPFGFTNVEVSDIKNLAKLTGTNSILSTDDSGTKIIEKKINAPMNAKFKAHPIGEGIYEFIERLGKRFGYHCWAAVDGKTLFLGQPNFKSKPLYSLFHGNLTGSDNAQNLVLESTISFDWTKQPSAIIGFIQGHGGELRKQSLKVLMVNELLSGSDSENPDIVKLKTDYKEATIIPRRSYLKKPDQVLSTKFAKPIFMHDTNSINTEQLKNYVRNRMAEFQSKFLTVSYTVNRHSQTSYIGENAVWAVNTQVKVNDTVNGINGNLWIKSRTFTKDRHNGTRTTIECILPYTYELSPEG